MKDSHISDEIIDEAEDISPAVDAEVEILDENGSADEPEPVDDLAAELERELTVERDKHLRLAAEFDNFRKRMMKERSEAESRGQAELVRQLLDPFDDIARFAHVDPAATDSATLVEGVALVERKLEKLFRAAGLEPVRPAGEKFDPSVHEAVATEPTDKRDLDGIISQVYQLGYTFKGQLLRPARVVVRQYQDAR